MQYVVAKYLHGQSFFSVKVRHEASWVWRFILSTRDTLKKGVCWRVSTRIGLDVWNAPWVPNSRDFKPSLRVIEEQNIHWVSKLILENPRRWNLELLQQNFDEESVKLIKNIQLGEYCMADKLIWSPSNNGSFSTKFAFWTTNIHRFENLGPLTKSE